jgi:uncharacterized Fe-S cluster-containing protein
MNGNMVLPGLDCGLCGYPTCKQLLVQLAVHPEWIDRCVNRSNSKTAVEKRPSTVQPFSILTEVEPSTFLDSYGREVDFYVDPIEGEPGAREDIVPSGGVVVTRELDLHEGEILTGRPLGVSCGCPVLHFGRVMVVDNKTGVITWCIVGPMIARKEGSKDLGPYGAQAYEGIVKFERSKVSPLKLGIRYDFLPGVCMMQWRHSGLLNAAKRIDGGWWVRLEGIWIK